MKHTDILDKVYTIGKISPDWLDKMLKINVALIDLFEKGTLTIKGNNVNIKSYLLSTLDCISEYNYEIYNDFIPTYAIKTVLPYGGNNNVATLREISLRKMLSVAINQR